MFAPAAGRTRYLGPILRSLRVQQWVKNLFVLAPLLFSKRIFEGPRDLALALAAFGLFCIASGVVYLVNDVMDLQADRAHPTKRHRPLASGALPIGVAIRAATTMVGGSMLLAFLLDYRFALTLAGYLLLNLAYSRGLKHLPWIDVLCIAAGFVLRVAGGGLVIRVDVSQWLVLCTFLLALVLGLGKRKHELEALAGAREGRRGVLDRYNPRTLDVGLVTAATATIAAYTFYTIDPRTIGFFNTDRLNWTVPLIVFGILRFLQLVDKPHADSPTEEMLRDKVFLANVALWFGAVLWLVGSGR